MPGLLLGCGTGVLPLMRQGGGTPAPGPSVRRTIVGSGSPTSNTLSDTGAGTWYGQIGGTNPIVAGAGAKSLTESHVARRWRAGVLREGATLLTQQTRTEPSQWRSRINGADGQVIIVNPGDAIPTGSSTVFADPTNLDAIADGDLVNNALVFEASSGFMVNPHVGYVFETEAENECWFSFYSVAAINYSTSALRYLGFTGFGAQSTTSQGAPMQAAGTLDRLQVHVNSAGAATKLFATNINGSVGQQVAVMSTAALIEDATNIDAVALGDLAQPQMSGGGTTAAYSGGGVRFRGDDNVGIVISHGANGGVGGNGVSPGNFWSGFNQLRRNNVDGESRNAIPAAGVCSNVAVNVGVNVNEDALTFATRRSGVNLNGVVAIPALTAGVFSDPTNIDAFETGENINHTSPQSQDAGTDFMAFGYRFEVAQ